MLSVPENQLLYFQIRRPKLSAKPRLNTNTGYFHFCFDLGSLDSYTYKEEAAYMLMNGSVSICATDFLLLLAISLCPFEDVPPPGHPKLMCLSRASNATRNLNFSS